MAGCVVTLCWPALANRLNVFEKDGMRSLGECWVVLWLAVVAGRAVRARTRWVLASGQGVNGATGAWGACNSARA